MAAFQPANSAKVVGRTPEARLHSLLPHRHPPSQTCRTFVDNHMKTMVSVDFFTVLTIRFKILYVFLVGA